MSHHSVETPSSIPTSVSAKCLSSTLTKMSSSSQVKASPGQRIKSHGSNSLKFSIDSLLTRKKKSCKEESSSREDRNTSFPDETSSKHNQRIANLSVTQTDHEEDVDVDDEDESSHSEDDVSDSCEDARVASTSSNNPFFVSETVSQAGLNMMSFPQIGHASLAWSPHLSHHGMPHNHHPFLGWMRSVQSNSQMSPSSTLLSEYLWCFWRWVLGKWLQFVLCSTDLLLFLSFSCHLVLSFSCHSVDRSSWRT